MASTSQAVTTLKAQLFVDLDGVLASYDEGFFRTFACTSVEAEERGLKIWDMIGAHPDFYANLDPLPGALDFWREILDHYPHPVILTSAGESHYRQNAWAKLRWVRKHLGPDVLFTAVKGGRRKGAYAQKPSDILIDDYIPNCAAWKAAGGTPIHHQAHEDSIHKLKYLLEHL